MKLSEPGRRPDKNFKNQDEDLVKMLKTQKNQDEALTNLFKAHKNKSFSNTQKYQEQVKETDEAHDSRMFTRKWQLLN